MASNILSRLLPSASDENHVEPQRHLSPEHDLEDAAGMAIDEENLGERFQDQDLEQLLAEAAGSDIGTESVAYTPSEKPPRRSAVTGEPKTKPKWKRKSPTTGEGRIDDDDDVPESLMLEGRKEPASRNDRHRHRNSTPILDELPPPVPGPTTRTSKAQWEATRNQQRLHEQSLPMQAQPTSGQLPRRGFLNPDPKERAMWKWANVENLDNFLQSVYEYYQLKGIWSILLRRVIALLSIAFIMGFSTFMLFCINYSELPNRHKLSEIRVPKCSKNLPIYWDLFIWLFVLGWMYSFFHFLRSIPRLMDLHNFYHHLLGISDKDLQTATWPYVVGQIMELRDENPATARPERLSADNRRFINGQSKQRMDAHDIANRLMRKENYLIAIINRDILDCNVHIPFIGKRHFFSKTIEWNIGLAVVEYVFDENGQIRQPFLSSRKRSSLIEGMKRRFFLVGCMNLIISPIIVIFFLINQFLMNFTEYQKNPAELGARDWTPLARWKFREFNELNHLFNRRLTMAYPYSDQYLNQFPNDRLGQAAQFVVFITGGLGAVLALVSLLDPELFLGFEINGRTVLFWLGALGVVWKVARGLVPPDDIVFDPEMWLHQVMEHTHYCPKTWENRFHTDEVRQEFSTFYKLELVLFFEEVASVILTPFVFIFCLPRCAAQLVDFYREFTIHVDGLGHVCSYAVFDFKRGGEPNHRAGHNPNDLRNDYWAAKDNKLAESYQTFMLDYADAPRKGLRQPRNKRQFHLPPSFPGLAASRVHPGLGQSAHHTPRFEPARAAHAPSPMHSVLLDPHHQPRHSPRQGPQARFRGAAASRHQILDADPDEHDEELLGPPAKAMPQRTPSQIIEEDSELGDSWAVKADAGNDNGGVNEGQGVPEGDAVGVLGLLYQFQKAQTEGRGINI